MKKLIILVFICSLLVVSCKKNEKAVPVISNELIDFVFADLENDISIVVPGIEPSDLIVKASVGNLSGEKGLYKYLVNEIELKNGEINAVEFTILHKDKKGNEVSAGSKIYKIKALPEVELKYAGKTGGEATIDDILKCDSLNYNVPGFYYNDSIFGQIIGYTLTIHNITKAGNKSDTSTTKYVLTGSKFDMAVAQKMITLKNGDVFVFSDATVMFKGKPQTVKENLYLVFKGK
jgi:hypothetical protein